MADTDRQTVGRTQSNAYALLGNAELITTDRKLYWSQQIGCNILMLMPMGFLLPCLHQKFRKLGSIFLIALIFSAAIEITQYFTGRGLCEFDDVFNNTLGACIGFIMWKKLSH